MIFESKKFYGRFIGQPISARNLFCNLPPATRKKIASLQERKKINEGEIICQPGNFPQNIYVLIDGKAKMTFRNGLNQKQNTRLIENGEIIGLTQSISGSPNELDIVALSPCSVDSYQTKDFLNFLKDDPQVCFRLANQMSLNIESDYKVFSSMLF